MERKRDVISRTHSDVALLYNTAKSLTPYRKKIPTKMNQLKMDEKCNEAQFRKKLLYSQR